MQPRTSSSSDAFSRRVEAAIPEALAFLPGGWTHQGQEAARALVERVLAAAGLPDLLAENEKLCGYVKDAAGDQSVLLPVSSLAAVSAESDRLRAVEQSARAFVDHVEQTDALSLDEKLRTEGEWRHRSHRLYNRLRSALLPAAVEDDDER